MPPPLSFPPDGQLVHFQEAIRAAEARNVVLPDAYYGQLQGLARQKAFSIAGIAAYDQLKAVLDDLNKAQANGQTFKQWQRNPSVKALELPVYRLDNLFRTNIQGQYMAGRWEQITRTQDSRPYLMYDAINDSRTRPAHKALDGFIRPVNDPVWRRISPLNGYRCRCGLISLTEAQAKARSADGRGLDKAYDSETMQPDKGWDYSPQDRLLGINKAIADRQGGGVLSSALAQQINQDMKITTLEGFAEAQQAVANLAKQKPDWFPLGFNGIHAVSNPELFAAFDRERGLFYMSAADELVPGFSPAIELQAALGKIKAGKPLSFNNEYALEALWHEITHGTKNIAATRIFLDSEPLEEGVVQLTSRYSYGALLAELGAEARHQEKIIASGWAYQGIAQNLHYLAQVSGIAQDEWLGLVTTNDWKSNLKDRIAKGLAVSTDKAGQLLNLAGQKSPEAFKAKITVQVRNARNNKDAP
jgi:SPP1 gp7 family putative phage head morphogenesis protein